MDEISTSLPNEHIANEQGDVGEAEKRDEALDRGNKTNDAILASSISRNDDAIEGEKWMQDHQPKLHKEMKEFGVPFSPDEFKKQGFAFTKDSSNKPHVIFPTPEYKEWLNKPEEERGPRPVDHHETAMERMKRLEKEKEIFWVDDKIYEIDQLIPGDNKIEDVLKGCSWEEKRDILRSVEKYQDRFSEKNILDKTDAREVYWEAINSLAHGNISTKEVEGGVEIDQEVAWEDAAKKALLHLAGTYVEPYRDAEQDWFNKYEKRYLNSIAQKIESQLGNAYLTKTEKVEKIITERVKEFSGTEGAPGMARSAILSALYCGEYFKDNNSRNVKLSDKFLELYGVDKNDPNVIMNAYRYANHNDQYIGMSDHVIEQALSGEEYPIKYNFHKNETEIEVEGEAWINFTSEFDRKVENGIREKVSERVELLGIKQEPEYMEALEKDKKQTTDSFCQEVKNKYILDSLLGLKSIGVKTHNVDKYLKEKYGPAFGAYGAYPLTKNEEVGVDLREQLRKRFVELLEEGAKTNQNWWGRNTTYFVLDAFNDENLANVEQNLDLDLSSPEVFDKSISGFLNTLECVNGEYSKQANWYYENIYANNPDEFYSRMMDLKKSKDYPRGLKAKITRFMKTNEAYLEYEQQRLFEKMARDAEKKQRSSAYRSIMRDASGEEINSLIRKRQIELIREIKEAGAETIETFKETEERQNTYYENESKEKKEAPKDFGIRKVEMLKTWKEHIEATYFADAPDEKRPKFFVDTFPVVGMNNDKLDNVILDDELSYIGFQFEYGGNLCVIAESFNTDAGMYLFRGEPGDNFKEMFDGTKADSLKDPRVVRVDHLNRENIEDSIDLTYQKAFLYLRTGDKNVVHYNVFGNNGREDWEEYRDIEYPAWPMNIEKEEIDPEELARYREWQRRQEEM